MVPWWFNFDPYPCIWFCILRTGLRNADFSHGDSDPYCILEVPGSDKGFRTEVVEDSSSPVWNVSNKLMVTPQETLQFVVWDRDKLDSDDLLGKVGLWMLFFLLLLLFLPEFCVSFCGCCKGEAALPQMNMEAPSMGHCKNGTKSSKGVLGAFMLTSG